MAKKRGRPVKSEVRQQMVDILSVLGSAYGYEIYKHHKDIFPKVTLRLVYYHLKKGVDLGLFKKGKVEASKGEYSWGPEAEKQYYELGPSASVTDNALVKEHFKK